VCDYWAIAFLKSMHRVADGVGTAGALALAAGIDVELPDSLYYGKELAELVRSGEVPEELVDRAARRLLRQKTELGLLDPQWTPEATAIDLDSPRNRAIAREIAEKSVVLLANDGILPPESGEGRGRRPVRRRPAGVHGLILLPEPRPAPTPSSGSA